MRTVTIGIATLDQALSSVARALEGIPQGESILFESVEQLWSTMTPSRWELVRAMTGAGAMSIRAAARLVGKDVKNVHADVQALLKVGVLEREEGLVLFPFDVIHVDFMIGKAA